MKIICQDDFTTWDQGLANWLLRRPHIRMQSHVAAYRTHMQSHICRSRMISATSSTHATHPRMQRLQCRPTRRSSGSLLARRRCSANLAEVVSHWDHHGECGFDGKDHVGIMQHASNTIMQHATTSCESPRLRSTTPLPSQ